MGLTPEQISNVMASGRGDEALRQSGVANIVNSIFKGQELEAGRTAEARLSKKSDADVAINQETNRINLLKAQGTIDDNKAKQGLRDAQTGYYKSMSDYYASGGKGDSGLSLSKEERIKQKDLADTATKILMNPTNDAVKPQIDRWNLSSPESTRMFYWDTDYQDEALMIDLPVINGRQVNVRMVLDTVETETARRGSSVTPEEVLRGLKVID